MYEYSLHLAAAAQTTETLEKRARILSVVYQTLDLAPVECAFIECSAARVILYWLWPLGQVVCFWGFAF